MTTTTSTAHPQARVGALLRILLLAAATAASWFAWFGWDHEYQTDPATGVVSGPYETWQGVGCVLTLLVIGVLALVARIGTVTGVLVMTVSFTAAWCVTELPNDDSGLAGVGAAMVFAGVGLATWLWFGLASAIRAGRR